MKRFFLLGILFSQFALASNRDPANLKNIYFCFNLNSVQIEKVLEEASPQIRNIIFQKLLTKIIAYRLPRVSNCDKAIRQELYVQVDAFAYKSGGYVYSMSANLYDRITFPGLVSTWESESYGTTPNTGSALAQDLSNSLGEILDDLAADYAKANP